MAEITDREKYQRRINALELERQSWLVHWKEINEVLLPRSGRFFNSDSTNKGNRRNDRILDNTSTRALVTLAAGMQSGLTSPARPWLKLETADPKLMEVAAVSTWLDEVTQGLLRIFAKSNTYRTLHSMYSEMGAYGTACCFVLPDFKDVIRLHPMTVGEYCISTNERGEPDTVSRGLEMTVRQIVERFVRTPDGNMDWTNITPAVKSLWDGHNHDSWIPIYHLVQPRADRDSSKSDPRNMPFESVYFERGANSDKVLKVSGYKRFPAVAPRWEIVGNDIYSSSSPGMVAIGDIQQLQLEQLRKAQGIDYQTNPPLQVPSSLKSSDSDFLPGGLTYVDMTGPQSTVRTAFDVRLELNHLLLDIQDVRKRIDGAFFSDVFLFLQNMEGMRGQKTAREIAEIHEEKLLMLGPVTENVENGLLAPLTDIGFDAGLEAGVFDEPPPEMRGQEISVQFIGLLSQAQRSVSMAGIDRIIGAVASIAAAKQDQSVWDKINTDNVVDKAATYIGIDPELIRTKDQVQQLRDARAKQQQAAAMQAHAAQAADTAKTLAGADMQSNNALTQLVGGGFSGV